MGMTEIPASRSWRARSRRGACPLAVAVVNFEPPAARAGTASARTTQAPPKRTKPVVSLAGGWYTCSRVTTLLFATRPASNRRAFLVGWSGPGLHREDQG